MQTLYNAIKLVPKLANKNLIYVGREAVFALHEDITLYHKKTAKILLIPSS